MERIGVEEEVEQDEEVGEDLDGGKDEGETNNEGIKSSQLDYPERCHKHCFIFTYFRLHY